MAKDCFEYIIRFGCNNVQPEEAIQKIANQLGHNFDNFKIKNRRNCSFDVSNLKIKRSLIYADDIYYPSSDLVHTKINVNLEMMNDMVKAKYCILTRFSSPIIIFLTTYFLFVMKLWFNSTNWAMFFIFLFLLFFPKQFFIYRKNSKDMIKKARNLLHNINTSSNVKVSVDMSSMTQRGINPAT